MKIKINNKSAYLAGIVALTALIILLPLVTNVFEQKKQTIIKKISFDNPLSFSYDLTKISMSDLGAKLLNKNDKADIILLDPIKINKNDRIIGFEEYSRGGKNTKISYQL